MKILFQAKKLVTGAVTLSFIIGMIASGPHASASGAVFNRLQGDLDTLVGRTQNQESYSDPVDATVQDEVTVAMYVHNGGDTDARNTRVSLQALTSGEVQTHKLRAAIWADNADLVNETVVNGQIVGQPDLTINLDAPANMSYIPGSTLWYPNFSDNPSESGIPMPDGIMSSAGINLGDLGFCWSTVGYVLASFSFAPTVRTAHLQTDKWVALFGGGNNEWVKENTAQPADLMRYQIYYNNNGNGDAKDVKITDTLPVGVTYQAGSIVQRIKDANNQDLDILIPDSAVQFNGQTITIPLGTVKPGQNNSGFIYMRVKVDNLSVGTHVLINNETVSASNADSVSASAKTTVVVNPTPVPDLHILKEVVNTTQGATNWERDNTAKPGDHMQYRLTIYNQGNAPADNVTVKDTLPADITYVAGSTKLYIATSNDPTSLPDGITATGISLGTVQNGVPTGNKFIVFEVIVSPTLPAGTFDRINKAEVFMAGVKKDESTARTTITATVGLLIEKTIWNAGSSQWVTRLEGVKPGNVILYRIQIKNTGNTTITNPVVKDTLPQLVRYIAGSTLMDGSVQVNDTWITQNAGILIANATPGFVKTITFKVTIGACPPGGSSTLTNSAFVIADGISQKTATADVVVTAGPPPIPR